MLPEKFLPVIMSGGAGTRLWPVSRELNPKPFIQLPDGESLLQKAYARVTGLAGIGKVLTVTNSALYFRTEGEYRALEGERRKHSYILEPMGRNTAPAIAMATAYAARRMGEDTVLLVIPADHLIADKDGFESAVKQAAELAQQGKIVTFGIKPTYAETGYGYIEAQGTSVQRFVEKPALELAESYVADGNYWWNAGIFCFSAGTMLREMARLVPEIHALIDPCLEGANTDEDEGYMQLELPADRFAQMPDVSIDYAVMEKTDAIAMVPCDIGWNDIGSWAALSGTTTADSSGNRIVGEAVVHDARNCYIQSQHRMVGVVGVEDLIVIDTPDALLITSKERSQDVKHIVGHLREKNHEAYKLHRMVHRPWGTYTVLEEGEGFKIKRIEVLPGHSLSLQMHQHRSEHWVVVSGSALVQNGSEMITLEANQSTYIPAGHKHRLENPGKEMLILIEVQSGAYLGEDDIVRFQDVYGRCG